MCMIELDTLTVWFKTSTCITMGKVKLYKLQHSIVRTHPHTLPDKHGIVLILNNDNR